MFFKCLNRALDARRSSQKKTIFTLFFLLSLGVIFGSVFVVIVALVVGVIVSGSTYPIQIMQNLKMIVTRLRTTVQTAQMVLMAQRVHNEFN